MADNRSLALCHGGSHHPGWRKGSSSRTLLLVEPSVSSTTFCANDLPCCEDSQQPVNPYSDDDDDNEAEVMKRVQHVCTGSLLPPIDWEYPTFCRREVILRKCLGRGTFSSVEEIGAVVFAPVRRFRLSNGADSRTVDNRESRHFIAENCIRSTGQPRYAMKALRTDVTADPQKRWTGIADLLIETHFLRHLEHPNIIKLRGVASGNPYSTGYFLVLDRLYCTLQAQLVKWNRQEKRNNSAVGFIIDPRRKGRKNLLGKRLIAAYHLSAAIAYLHARNIIHRDIKPENIGFDVRGDIKIFDFGLARELLTRDANSDGTYNISHMTGSLRYMAPEVYWEDSPYNASCDVYSFAILFWQMLALECPFREFIIEEVFVKQVFRGGLRPSLEKIALQQCRDMLSRAWDENFRKRPSIDDISRRLRHEVMDLELGEETDLDTVRRRSTFVFEKNINQSTEDHVE